MFREIVESIEDIDRVAQQFIEQHDSSIFAFYGGMGVGKTTFVKAICKARAVLDYVNSPTFSLVNEYACEDGSTLYHFDFYRIESIEEAYDFGYETYFYSGNTCFIEWPQLIEPILPEGCVKVTITELPDGRREIRSEYI